MVSIRVQALINFAIIVLAPVIVLLAFLTYGGPRTLGEVDLYALNRPTTFTFVNDKGDVLGHSGAITGERLPLSDMPVYLPAAFLAMEDRRFFHHGSADIWGIIRAFRTNFEAGHTVAGGSTITQQTAKMLFLNSERTLSRKLQELAAAWTLEHNFTKEQILALYLNRVYLGAGAFGVDAAARQYFGKSARDVTLSEAAMLAALAKAPSGFSPRHDLKKAQERAALVLETMAQTRLIDAAVAERARENPATIVDRGSDPQQDYFFDAAAAEAKRFTLDVTGDFVVVTTLDPIMQAATHSVTAQMFKERGETATASQVAMVVMSTDGAVRALLGGRDYGESQFDRATQSKRQPGSAFKGMVYLTALEQGFTPGDMLDGSSVDFHGYQPKNYNDAKFNKVTLATALAQSINTATVRLLTLVGVDAVIKTAHRLGIDSPLQPNLSLALGTSEVTPVELTSAYASFASGGYLVTPYMVKEVRTGMGTVLYRRRAPAPTRVVAPIHVRTMDQMLHGVVTSGTGRGANLPDHYVAGKTGTSAEYHDAWFVGYTEGLTGTVWVGNDDLTPMNRITGGTIPAAIWKQVMATTLAAEPAPAPPAGQTPIAMASNDDGLRLSEKEFPVALADFEQEDRVLEDDQYDMTAPRVETR